MTGLAVLLLAARKVAMRRSAELTVVRARGASLRQVDEAIARSQPNLTARHAGGRKSISVRVL